jgi:hypothetical protein
MNIYRHPDGFKLLAATYTLPSPRAPYQEAISLYLQQFWRFYAALRLFWFGSLLMCARPFLYYALDAIGGFYHSFGIAGAFWGVVFTLPFVLLIVWLSGTYGLIRTVLLGDFERVQKIIHYWLPQKRIDLLPNRKRFRREVSAWSRVLERLGNRENGNYWADVACGAGLPLPLAQKKVRFIRALTLLILFGNGFLALWLLGLPHGPKEWIASMACWLVISIYSIPIDFWALFTKNSPMLAAYTLVFKYNITNPRQLSGTKG